MSEDPKKEPQDADLRKTVVSNAEEEFRLFVRELEGKHGLTYQEFSGILRRLMSDRALKRPKKERAPRSRWWAPKSREEALVKAGLSTSATMEEIRAIPASDLDLSIRAINCLAIAKISTVDELTRWTAKDLLKVRNCGMKVVGQVRDALADLGLHLKGDEP